MTRRARQPPRSGRGTNPGVPRQGFLREPGERGTRAKPNPLSRRVSMTSASVSVDGFDTPAGSAASPSRGRRRRRRSGAAARRAPARAGRDRRWRAAATRPARPPGRSGARRWRAPSGGPGRRASGSGRPRRRAPRRAPRGAGCAAPRRRRRAGSAAGTVGSGRGTAPKTAETQPESRCSTSTRPPVTACRVADGGQHRAQHLVPGDDHAEVVDGRGDALPDRAARRDAAAARCRPRADATRVRRIATSQADRRRRRGRSDDVRAHRAASLGATPSTIRRCMTSRRSMSCSVYRRWCPGSCSDGPIPYR